MVHRCFAFVLLIAAAGAAAQPAPEAPPAGRFPGLFGFTVSDPVDPVRLRAAGFAERRDGPLEFWRLERPDAFFGRIDVTPMPGNLIGMIAARASFARPAGVADSPAARAELMGRCQPTRAALVEAMFHSYFQRANATSTYVAERVQPGQEIADTGARNANVGCLLDPVTGAVTLSVQLGRSDF